jgi:hypothetical protein
MWCEFCFFADCGNVLCNLTGFDYCAIQLLVLCIFLYVAMGEIDKGTPQVGMRFRNPDEAWVFWVAYEGRAGFDVRKRNKHVSKMDGQVTSCTFVCSNEGIRKKG